MDILETHAFDRRQKRTTFCVLLFSLLPFFMASAAYLYLLAPDFSPSVSAAIMKTAPTFLLAVVVLGRNGLHSLLGVAGGLLFSAVGDFCLVWPERFIHGMAAFAVAHLQYSFTFLTARYSPPLSSSSWLRLLYVLLLVNAVCFYIYMYPYLQRAPQSALLTPSVGVYVGLISIMAALALRTRRKATLLGSLMFLVSDLSLALQLFKVVTPLQHGHVLVMTTYYLAQLLIAVGDVIVVEDDFGKWKRS